MTRRAYNFRSSGFTLLELVVAMGIVAIIAISLYASLRIAFEAKAHSETAVEPSRTAQLALDLIGQDISSTMPHSTQVVSFEGTDGTDDRGRSDDDLVFYSTADSPQHVAANGEIKNIELTVIQPVGGNDHVLVRRVIRNLFSQTNPTPDVEVICRNVGGFNLRYYDGTEWVDSWDSTQEEDTPPVAVEVTLELDRPDATQGTRTFRFVRVFPIAVYSPPATS